MFTSDFFESFKLHQLQDLHAPWKSLNLKIKILDLESFIKYIGSFKTEEGVGTEWN